MEAILGLDIGRSGIKAAEIVTNKNERRLENLFHYEFPIDIITKGTPEEKEAARENALKEIFAKMIVDSEVSISLAYEDIVMERLSLAVAPKDEIASMVKWELTDKLTYPVDEAQVDYVVLGKRDELGTERLNVLAFSVWRNKALKIVSDIEKFGVKVVNLQPPNLGVTHLLNLQSLIKEDEVIGVFDLGAEQFSFYIIYEGNVQFYHNVSVNGNIITKSIADYCSMSFDEAEKAKRRVGLVAVEKVSDGGGYSFINPTDKQIAYTVNSQLEKLINEVERSFKYFSFKLTLSQIKKMNRIFVLGGGANLRGLTDFIATRLYVPVEVLNPFKGLVYVIQRFDSEYLKKVSPLMANSIGACLVMSEVG